MPLKEKLRMAWFSPLNLAGDTTTSAAAYVSELLLPRLKQHFEIELFHNSFKKHQDFPTHHFLSAFKRDQKKPFDIFFYQLEDNDLSRFLRIAVGLHPGVIWYHDLLYSNDGPEPILNSPWEPVVNKFFNSDLSWPDRGNEYFKKGPFGAREAGLGVLSLFSSVRDLGEYMRQLSRSLLLRNEELLTASYLPWPVDLKALKNMKSEKFNLALRASTQIEGRTHKLFQALNGFKHDYKLKWLVDESELSLARAMLDEFSVQAQLIVDRGVSSWITLLNEASVALHPRFTVYGQGGPYMAASIASGAPVISTNFGDVETLPDSIVFKISPGDYEAAEITALLNELYNSWKAQDGKIDLKSAAQAYSEEFYDHYAVADELVTLLKRSTPGLKSFNEKWRRYSQEARESLLLEAPGYLPPMTEQVKVWERGLAPGFNELGWSVSDAD